MTAVVRSIDEQIGTLVLESQQQQLQHQAASEQGNEANVRRATQSIAAAGDQLNSRTEQFAKQLSSVSTERLSFEVDRLEHARGASFILILTALC